ncbi:unnamed protein product [Agarophyton chilense]
MQPHTPIWRGFLRVHGSSAAFHTRAVAIFTSQAPTPDWPEVLHLRAAQSAPAADHHSQILASRYTFRIVAVDDDHEEREDEKLTAVTELMADTKWVFKVPVANGCIFVWAVWDDTAAAASLLGAFYAQGTLGA